MFDKPNVRLATENEMPALAALIERSFRALGAAHYPPEVIAAACGSVIRLDPGLVTDGTYFLVEREDAIAGCGGWSTRIPTLHDAILPEPRAEVRALFVAPEQGRRGVGSALLASAERAIAAAGFDTAYLVATRSGRAFFERAGYQPLAEHEAGAARLAVTSMRKRL